MKRSHAEHIADLKRWLKSGESLNAKAYQMKWELTGVQMARYINEATMQIKEEEK